MNCFLLIKENTVVSYLGKTRGCQTLVIEEVIFYPSDVQERAPKVVLMCTAFYKPFPQGSVEEDRGLCEASFI